MSLPFRTAVVVSLACVVSAQAASFTSIVSFGDSLSDVGNLRNTTAAVLGTPLPGSPGYANGRFSNGPVWVEQLAPLLGVATPTASTTGGQNYAYGYAASGTGATLGVVPNVRTQIDNYAAAAASSATSLYTVLGGANDLIAALDNNATPAQQALVAQQAAANIAVGVQTLYNDGARNVLVANLPDLGAVPRYLGTPQQTAATTITSVFDTALATNLAALDLASPDLNLYSLDLSALFAQARLNPAGFGLTNVSDAAYTNDPAYAGTGTIVANPAGYLFWDSIHPSTQGHGLVAAAALAAVPEPTAAFAAVAIALPLLRRRRA